MLWDSSCSQTTASEMVEKSEKVSKQKPSLWGDFSSLYVVIAVRQTS
jgi:hypothetical protein